MKKSKTGKRKNAEVPRYLDHAMDSESLRALTEVVVKRKTNQYSNYPWMSGN